MSGHGFGHASRTVAVINALRNLRPGLPVLLSTSAPRAVIDHALTEPVDLRELVCDTGLAQLDSLHADEEASVRQAAEFHADLDRRAAREAGVLRAAGARLVLGDIPPLAFAAASAAGIPSVAVGNFTWDWIYEGFPEQLANHPALVPAVRRAYAGASVALRLPLHGGFAGLEARVRDVPLVARRSRWTRREARRALELPDGPLVLVSFGGYGIRGFDAHLPARLPGYRMLMTDPADEALPGRAGSVATTGELIRIRSADLSRRGLRYEDLVRAADAVVTKPGYGIVSECIANETAILYTSRGRFPEYDVLVAGMRRYTRSAFIDQEALLAGRWAPALDRLLAQPRPADHLAVDGAEVVADIVLRLLEAHAH